MYAEKSINLRTSRVQNSFLPAQTYNDVSETLASQFEEREDTEEFEVQEGERNFLGTDERIVGLLFSRPTTDLAKNELIPNLEYFYHRSGKHIDFFCGGYGTCNTMERVSQREIVSFSDSRWLFDAKSFNQFRIEIEARADWRYSGGTDLVIAVANYDRDTRSVNFDFDSAISINLEEAKEKHAILTVGHLLERVIRFAEDIENKPIGHDSLAQAFSGNENIFIFKDRKKSLKRFWKTFFDLRKSFFLSHLRRLKNHITGSKNILDFPLTIVDVMMQRWLYSVSKYSRSNGTCENIEFYRQQCSDLVEICKLHASRPINNFVSVEVTAESGSTSGSYMSSKYDMSRANIGNVVDQANSGSHVQSIAHNYTPEYVPDKEKTFSQAVNGIQELLNRLSQTYPSSTEEEKGKLVSKAVEEIQKNPTLKARISSALKAGGFEAIRELTDHPLVSILLSALEGWQEPN